MTEPATIGNLPASTAPLADGYPHVHGTCPACHHTALFLGVGGHITCATDTCPDSDAAGRLLDTPDGEDDAIHDFQPPEAR
jgi:hypothetical protein